MSIAELNKCGPTSRQVKIMTALLGFVDMIQILLSSKYSNKQQLLKDFLSNSSFSTLAFYFCNDLMF